MYAFELSLQYRRAVKDRDLEKILPLFAQNAVIQSPVKGACDPRTYHEWLFTTVKSATTEVQNVFQALNGDISISVQAQYRWQLNNDKVVNFGGVSVFEFTPDRKQITKLTAFNDTELLRSHIAEANMRSPA